MSVFVADEQSEDVDVEGLRHLAALVLEHESCPPDTEVAVILVGDEEMSGYNARFLERAGPTDVISLPVEELVAGRPPGSLPGGPPPLLGDVIIDPAYVRRQAEELEVGFEEDLALMVVHGILHLLGYDHDDDDAAGVMEDREREILAMMGRKR